MHQKRPYLALSDAMEAFKFIIKKGLFDKRAYNVLTANLTVNSIIEAIKEHIPQVDIEYVDTEIMNQLSYDVANERFENEGFEFTGSIEKEIEETIKLLGNSQGTA